MAKRDAPQLWVAAWATRRLRAHRADSAIGHRDAQRWRQLTAKIVAHAERIAILGAGAGPAILRADGRTGHPAAFVGQACLATAARAVKGLTAIVLPLAADIPGADLDLLHLAVFAVRFPGRCRISQREQGRGANTQAEETTGTDQTGETTEAIAIHDNPQATTPTY